MRDREWRLSYPGVELSFGPADDPVFHLSAPELSDAEVRADDVDRPRQDGRAFGVDLHSGRTVTFDLGVVGNSEAAVRDRLAVLSRAWRGLGLRDKPGAVAELRTRNAGRERIVYGRPRRFAANEEEIGEGIATVTADFATVDDLFYGDEESMTLGLVPATGGGLTGALAAPLSTTASSDRSTGIRVGGQLGAWPVATIYGPITRPVVEVVVTGVSRSTPRSPRATR
jgi:hypothetical protein